MLAAAVLALGVVGPTHPADAAAAPVTQCNNDTASNVGGQGIACTVTVTNYVTGTGTIDSSTLRDDDAVRWCGMAGRRRCRYVRDDYLDFD